MSPCDCSGLHSPRRIVLTGGPGAGKTAVLELVRRALCRHVLVLPEAAGILFGGGFPRSAALGARRAAQRAIFHVQRELEATVEGTGLAIVVCDRGTVDGAAYWQGPGDLWSAVGTTREAEHRRYDAVIHLRTPRLDQGYDHSNPLRIESAEEAARLDARIAEAWAGHPRVFTVEANHDFVPKATRAIALIQAEVPPCCAAPARAAAGGRHDGEAARDVAVR